MKHNDCFNCLHHTDGELASNTGWYHKCKFGIENEGLQNVKECEKYYPNMGFQIGGYYSFVDFQSIGNVDGNGDPCLLMTIHSNGDFPQTDHDEMIVFHICDFEQIEECVRFWGKYLREKGLIFNTSEDV